MGQKEILRKCLEEINAVILVLKKQKDAIDDVAQIAEKYKKITQQFCIGENSIEKMESNMSRKEWIKCFIEMKEKILIELNEFILIQRNAPRAGFGSHIGTNMMGILQGVLMDKIPIIDMSLSWDSEYGGGCWENFFQQPFGISISDIQTDLKYPVITNPYLLMEDFYLNMSLKKFWHTIYRRYMHYTPETLEYLNNEYDKYFRRGIDIHKVCGVLCRGTDIKNLQPKGHWVQPDTLELIAHVKKVMDYYLCEYVFLATEDKKIYDVFYREFGEKLLVTKTKMLDYEEPEYIYDVQKREKIDLFQNNLDYLSALYQLSKLDYFVGGNCTGTLCVHFMSEGFKYSFVYNKGRYLVDDEKTLTSILEGCI